MLTIAHLQANYAIPQGTPDGAAVQARLDRLARERLPGVVASHLEATAADAEAVYRIRHLEIDLWLDALERADGDIAERWGRLLVQALTYTLLYGPPGQVMRYDNHAHFVASFLADLLAGRAWSRWMYAEFTPLRDLPLGHTAAYLLAARPALLAPVAGRLAQLDQLEPLIQQLTPEDVSLIWENGLGLGDLPPIPDPGGLDDVLAVVRQVALEPGERPAVARNTLRLYLALLVRRGPASLAAAAVCYHLALLSAAAHVLPAPAVWSALAAGEITTPGALAPVLARLAERLPAAAAWLTTVLSTPRGSYYLTQLVPLAIPAAVPAEPAAAPKPRLAQVTTAFAGLAFLLPEIRELALHEFVGPAGLYQLLLAAVGQAYRPLAWSDAGPLWLAGLPATAGEKARAEPVNWPAPARLSSPKAAALGLSLPAEPTLGSDPPGVWANVLLRRLAAGLRGFAGSSPGYLLEQFIHLPGRIQRGADTVEVWCSRAPLGIVLHMAGRDGDQGTVPWLDDRRLVIHLPEG